MTGAGIDYSGAGGTCNRDRETGIRYGVISCNSLHPDALDWDNVEYDYGDPHGPKCGGNAAVVPSHSEQHGNSVSIIMDTPAEYEDYEAERGACGDYACEHCRYLFDGENAFSDEPLGWSVNDGEYQIQNCLDNDAMVVKSPYYTFACFCSPCVPGACSLDSPVPDGAQCYALGHDWFEDNIAPYPVYSVETGAILPAEAQS